jgi:hypothetical protein
VEYFGVTPKASVDFNSGVITSFSDSFKSKLVRNNDNRKEWTTLLLIQTLSDQSALAIMLIAESNKAAQRNMAQAAKTSFFYLSLLHIRSMEANG